MFLLTDLEKILQNTSGKYCVGDEVGHKSWLLMPFKYDDRARS